jgi:hypothetical protein
MHRSAFALQAATGLAITSLLAAPLAGCSGSSSALPTAPSAASSANSSQPAPAQGMGSQAQLSAQVETDAHHKKKVKLLFVSDNENNRVLVYNAASKTQNPPPIRTITNGVQAPNGITTDKSGNLYVANYVANTVTIYAPNASAPKTTISNGLNGPWDVKVDGFGNVFVANVPLYGGTNTVSEYPAGSSSPSDTWSAPSGLTISGIALLNPTMQGETSIYALAYSLNGSGFASGTALTCYPGSPTCTNLGYSFGQTGGIAVEQSPTSKPFEWLAVDQYIPGIDIFTQGQSSKQLVTGGTPEFIALNSTDNELFVADRFYGRVVEYSFPAGKELNSYSPGGAQVYGVATFPAGTYH